MNIFIDTQDMEERYGEELYKEYLENENKEMKEKIKKLRELLKDYKYTKVDDYHKIIEFYKMLEEILGDKENE